MVEVKKSLTKGKMKKKQSIKPVELTSSTIIPAKLSDKELYALCEKYGGNAKSWLKKFAGLLPEVYKRRLYKKRGCASIHEFAKKVAGMNEATVDKILNLRRKLEGKPELLKLFESGEEGWSKLESVAYIATPETDKQWAEKVELLPYHSLVLYVKDYREQITGAGERENIQEISQPTIVDYSRKISFHVSPETEFQLRLFKQKLEKEKKESLSWNEVFREIIHRLMY